MDITDCNRDEAGMPIAYRIDPPLVTVVPYGVNSLESVSAVFDRILADRDFDPPVGILFDACHTEYGPPSEELEALSEYLAGFDVFRQSRWAIVANPNTLVYGVTRMFCCLAESQGMLAEPFSDLERARAWLLDPQADRRNGNDASPKPVAVVQEVS